MDLECGEFGIALRLSPKPLVLGLFYGLLLCLVLLDVSSSLGRALSLEQTRRHMALNGVSKIRDTFLGEGLYSKDCSIFACIFGSPVLGNYQISQDYWSSVQKRKDF